ncbi:unnamed protein product, partial [Gongylonema pulchrum]|uniref:Uncharacterized protein n=1 Tax=Gongylonema pulchrum TaxID=637853 RepID=A0A183EI03_9BILA
MFALLFLCFLFKFQNVSDSNDEYEESVSRMKNNESGAENDSDVIINTGFFNKSDNNEDDSDDDDDVDDDNYSS